MDVGYCLSQCKAVDTLRKEKSLQKMVYSIIAPGGKIVVILLLQPIIENIDTAVNSDGRCES
jgi:hypothetical protein